MSLAYSSIVHKIALGTVQFGLDYGINNIRGRIPEYEVEEILDFALHNGIKTIDTASAYGLSEYVLGRALKNKNTFNIVSKLPPNVQTEEVVDNFLLTIARLRVDKLYGFLVHDFDSFKNTVTVYEKLAYLKDSRLVDKIGFSVYRPDEIAYLIEHDISFDLVQLPFNIFDQRFQSFFKTLKEKNVEIHVRSVFLQGLFFKKLDSLSPFFSIIKDKLRHLQGIAQINQIPIHALALGFALLHEQIDRVVIGVDGLSNLKENLQTLRYIDSIRQLMPELASLRETNENVLLPFQWQL